MEIKLKCESCDKQIESEDRFVHDDGEYFHFSCYWEHIEEVIWKYKDLER